MTDTPSPTSSDLSEFRLLIVNVNFVKLGLDYSNLMSGNLASRWSNIKYLTIDQANISSRRFDADISRSMTGKLTDAGQKYTIFGEWIKDYLGAIELFYY